MREEEGGQRLPQPRRSKVLNSAKGDSGFRFRQSGGGSKVSTIATENKADADLVIDSCHKGDEAASADVVLPSKSSQCFSLCERYV